LFAAGDPEPAATGHFVHVFVERATMKPVAIPGPLRACMERLRTA
jgi:acyl-CoA thioester hydrolase